MKLSAIKGAVLLPTGYTQTEYTESHPAGTQNGASICTAIKPSLDLVTEMDMEFTGWFSGASSFAFGSDPSDKNRYAVYVNSSKKWILGWDNATTSDTVTATENVRYKIKVDSGKLYIDGVLAAQTSATNVNTNCNIILYAYNYTANGNMPARFAKMKLYGVKFTRGGVLVGDFYPCKRDSDSAPGMYDLVSNTFYPCESVRGTGNYFIAGSDVTNYSLYKFANALRRYKAILPTQEYEDCNYVKSARASYIDTGYVPKANIEMEVRLKFAGTFQYGTGNTNAFFGITESDGRAYTINFGNSSNQYNNLFTWLSRSYDGSHTWQLNINADTRENENTLECTPTKVTYGAYSVVPQLKTEDMDHSLYIMGRKTAAGVVSAFTSFEMYVYEWIIREGSTEVRHYIPKRRTADGVYGLYDTVNNVFKPSDSATPFSGG
jgi:hypothetical protein